MTRVRARPGAVFILLGCFVGAFALLQTSVLAQDGQPVAHDHGGSVWMSIVTVCLLVMATLLFVLAETALLTVRRTRIEQLVDEGNRSAQLVQLLLSEPTRMLATLQVGLTLVTMFSAGAAEQGMQAPLSDFLQAKLGLSPYWAGTSAFFIVLLAVAYVTLVVGEITPKSLGIRHAERTALFFAWPIRWLQIILKPIVAFVTFSSNLIVRPFGGTVAFHASVVTADELKIIVDQIEEHGVIETGEKEMIHNVVDFGDTMVRKVMTQRLDITAVEADVDVDELIRVVTESGHSRIPVFDDDLDNIIGVIHVKDVLKGITEETRPESVRDLMRPAYFIPENKMNQDLLKEMQRSKTQMAVVRDEYGAVAGLVTIEDLLEEIVGEIQDEYDVEEEPDIICMDDGSFIVDGRMSLEDFNERMDVEVPEEGADTVGGFVFGLLGHQPDVGEAQQWDGIEFRVETTDGRRIQKVRVIRARRNDDANGAGKAPPPAELEETRPERPEIG